jgi:heterodisulfide reductase subunit A
MVEYPPERDISAEEPRVGVFICHCGTNIGGYLDVEALATYAKTLPDVAYVDHPMYTCAQDSQAKIVAAINEHKLNRIVVSACTPRTHEALFQETLKSAGLNPYLFEMANIRDQCSWIHIDNKEAATEKAKDLIAMSVAKAALLQTLPVSEVGVKASALVIGGGIAGMTSALRLAEQGFATHIIEQEDILGGRLNKIHYTVDGHNVADMLHERVEQVKAHDNITVHTSSTISSINGYIGNFLTEILEKGEIAKIEHGVVVVAVGTEEGTTTDYLYGTTSKVMSQHDLENSLVSVKAGGIKDGETFVMIQCVGSRNSEHPYCSRICCTQAVKNALKIKEINPHAEVYVLYRDMRTYGFKEQYYEQARDLGVVFVRYDDEHPPKVEAQGDAVTVAWKEQFLQEDITITADHVVLALGLRPREGREELAKMLKVPLNSDGFFLEAHVKLRPVDFATEGIFLAGTCHAPKFIDESIYQAEAAAGRAGQILSHTTYKATAVVAESNPEMCSGCGVCVSVCDYGAIELVTEKQGDEEVTVSKINQSLCKGCGCCVAACPSGAIEQRGFTGKQIEQMIKSALRAS